jgi:hypothetical protein
MQWSQYSSYALPTATRLSADFIALGNTLPTVTDTVACSTSILLLLAHPPRSRGTAYATALSLMAVKNAQLYTVFIIDLVLLVYTHSRCDSFYTRSSFSSLLRLNSTTPHEPRTRILKLYVPITCLISSYVSSTDFSNRSSSSPCVLCQ